nr:transposase [Streptomyces sp. YIM 121038]
MAGHKASSRSRPSPRPDTNRWIRAEWRTTYAKRSGVEGTIAQATRRCGIRHARYRGADRTHLQHVFTALALHTIRLDAWITGTRPAGSWTSRLSHLHHALTSPDL